MRKHRVPVLKAKLGGLMRKGGDRPVVCLQELEDAWQGGEEKTGERIFDVFEENDYVCVYAQRGNSGLATIITPTSPPPTPSQTLRPDGICIAYPREKYTLTETTAIDLDDLATTTSTEDILSSTFLRDQFRKQNVGLGLLLKTRSDDPKEVVEFYVGNCHLYWDPSREYVKLLQMNYFLERVRKLRYVQRATRCVS